MSSTSDNPRLNVSRAQFVVKGGVTPHVVNDFIPTEPVTINFGPSRGTSTKGVGSALLLGSKTLLGSPSTNPPQYNVGRLRITTGSPNVFLALTHSRRPGTFDTPFEVNKGDDLTVSEPKQAPIYSLPPGTIRVYALGPGSSITVGKGSTGKFQGFGSAAQGFVTVSMDLYPVG